MSIVKFSDVAHRANTKEDRFNTDKIYYVGGEHIDSNELFVRSKGIIKGSTIGPMFYCGFTSGQILFVTRNPHLRKCGIVDFDGICSEKTFVIESKDTTKLSQEYLAIIMQSDEFWNYCEENKSGGVNYFLNWSTLADYEFELPPIQIQEEIAEKVMSAYRLKQSYQKLLTATDEMIKSQFIEMLNTEGYEYLALGEVCSKITDGSHNPPKGCDSSDYIMISSKNISPDCLDLSDVRYLTKDEFESENKRTNVSANDILLTIVGTIGRTYLVKGNEGNIVMQRSVAVLTPNKNINPTFLMYSLLIDSELEKEGRGNAQKGVYLKQLAKFKVKIPSFKCQNKFCEIYNQADKSKFELRKSIEAIDAVIKNLING